MYARNKWQPHFWSGVSWMQMEIYCPRCWWSTKWRPRMHSQSVSWFINLNASIRHRVKAKIENDIGFASILTKWKSHIDNRASLAAKLNSKEQKKRRRTINTSEAGSWQRAMDDYLSNAKCHFHTELLTKLHQQQSADRIDVNSPTHSLDPGGETVAFIWAVR